MSLPGDTDESIDDFIKCGINEKDIHEVTGTENRGTKPVSGSTANFLKEMVPELCLKDKQVYWPCAE